MPKNQTLTKSDLEAFVWKLENEGLDYATENYSKDVGLTTDLGKEIAEYKASRKALLTKIKSKAKDLGVIFE